MGLLSGVRRLPDGGLRVRLTGRERELLRSLPAQLRPALSGEHGDVEISRRLYPPAYDDADADAEFRRLIGDDLRDERLRALDTFAASLDGGVSGRLGWSVELDAASADAWLSAVNDARLVLGCLLGISDEGRWETGPDEDSAASVVLYYLGWLQEELVAALLTGLPDG